MRLRAIEHNFTYKVTAKHKARAKVKEGYYYLNPDDVMEEGDEYKYSNEKIWETVIGLAGEKVGRWFDVDGCDPNKAKGKVRRRIG
jgi:hypothetical protein